MENDKPISGDHYKILACFLAVLGSVGCIFPGAHWLVVMASIFAVMVAADRIADAIHALKAK